MDKNTSLLLEQQVSKQLGTEINITVGSIGITIKNTSNEDIVTIKKLNPSADEIIEAINENDNNQLLLG